MNRLFEFAQFDRLSFWLGFLAASLVWWLVPRLRSLRSQDRNKGSIRSKGSDAGKTYGVELRFRNEVWKHVQGLHLAAPLFPLDEILIIPKFLPPVWPVEPGTNEPPEDIVTQTIPYLPDWPELAAEYLTPSLSIGLALGGRSHLVILGGIGSGKTTCLAYLASLLAHRDPSLGNLKDCLPIYVHVVGLYLSTSEPHRPIDWLSEALSCYMDSISARQLHTLLEEKLRDGKAVLILDGMDELATDEIAPVLESLDNLSRMYPKIVMVTTANPDNILGLTERGFYPVSIKSWSAAERSHFLQRWGEAWSQHLHAGDNEPQWIDPLILNNWLAYQLDGLSPLDITLKIWSAYAGDKIGVADSEALEAYLHRLTDGSEPIRRALQDIAALMVHSGKGIIPRKAVEGGYAWATLENNELIYAHSESHIAFKHAKIAGYLAACGLTDYQNLDQIDWNKIPRSAISDSALIFLVLYHGATWMVDQAVESDQGSLHATLFRVARWINGRDNGPGWQVDVVNQLARLLQAPSNPIGLRARCLVALAVSHHPNAIVLIRQMLVSQDAVSRQLAALGCGYLRDTQAVQQLIDLLDDSIPGVHRAACLALARIGNKTTLQALFDLLLRGDENQRHAAAEALANDPMEGHQILKEASETEDDTTRRASIYGLKRIQQPWSNQILQSMEKDDKQWIIRFSAAQALEQGGFEKSYIPKPLPPLSEMPWLIAFAGERGIGLSPGKPTYDILFQALREGNEEQQVFALSYLSLRGDQTALEDILDIYRTTIGEVREAAFNTLWMLAARGTKLS